ncbi:MAG TPA: hypothetical protein IAA52_08105 [Candidatus Pullichristensenella stercorigallinarum]|uniref:Uncharacterized protein n=1 Tax=Candidatus Pullichristensenella stercorigallinarum TaxID=2840909 RepID=A0A9D0ZM30_9FIRM|nr:hypothetical protein [Candidatus Pullichristensenella stercorigallinarum]
MKQKTFKSDEKFKVGDLVILLERSYINDGYSTFDAIPYTGDGISGNMDSSIKRFHGWRGTTNDVAQYAHGVRKIIRVGATDEWGEKTKYTVGADLHPDWE